MLMGLPSSERFDLCQSTGTATEGKIREQHFKALALFDEKMENQPQAELPYRVEVGQIIFTDFRGDRENPRAVYEVVRGGKYKTVLLDGSRTNFDDHVRDYRQKFGIGSYYNEGEKISQEEINDLLISAHQAETKRQADKLEADRVAKEKRARDIAAGREIVPSVPTWAKSVIIGELMQDDSDSQSDYFASHSIKTVFLAWSSHDRDLFPELRKAAANCPQTAEFAIEPEPEYYNNGGTTCKKHPKDEHREKYSMGSGYYLGGQYRAGWKVRKDRYSMKDAAALLEAVQEAAGQGRYFIPTADHTPEPTATSAGVEVLDYSEKAVAVFGDTRPLKDQLKALGGRFNPYLTHPTTGQRTPGWIFPKSKAEALKTL